QGEAGALPPRRLARALPLLHAPRPAARPRPRGGVSRPSARRRRDRPMTSNEDFLFAQEAVALGFVTDGQVKEALELQRRMAEDLRLDERLAVLLVKRGYLAEDQARRVYAKIQPSEGGPGDIQGYRLLEVVG